MSDGQAEKWLDTQRALLLPVTHFMATFTLPEELRDIVSRHQKKLCSILFRTAAGVLREVDMDSRFIGARIGMVAVLHTWTRQMLFHPHVRFLVVGGALWTSDGKWHPSRIDFFLPVRALSRISRAKFRDEMSKAGLFDFIPSGIWEKEWNVNCQAVGESRTSTPYLAPYVFKVAISNHRIVKVEHHKVSFRCRKTHSNQWRTMALDAMEFMRRFLRHVLPQRIHESALLWIFASPPQSRHRYDRGSHPHRSNTLIPQCVADRAS